MGAIDRWMTRKRVMCPYYSWDKKVMPLSVGTWIYRKQIDFASEK